MKHLDSVRNSRAEIHAHIQKHPSLHYKCTRSRMCTWFLSCTVNSWKQSEDEVAHIYTKPETVSCPAVGESVNTTWKCVERKRKAAALRPTASSALWLVYKPKFKQWGGVSRMYPLWSWWGKENIIWSFNSASLLILLYVTCFFMSRSL